jgi:hypothetical protein
MKSIGVTSIVFGLVFAAALAGIFLRPILPHDLLGSEDKEVVRLTTGLLTTMSALVPRRTLLAKARLLLSITEYLRLAERPNGRIALPEIEKAADRWSTQNWPSSKSSHARFSRNEFITEALGWLRLLNRLQTIPKRVTVCDSVLAEFSSFMKNDRGLSLTTVRYRCNSVRPFLEQMLDGERFLKMITVTDVDSLLTRRFQWPPSMHRFQI